MLTGKIGGQGLERVSVTRPRVKLTRASWVEHRVVSLLLQRIDCCGHVEEAHGRIGDSCTGSGASTKACC
jgi:hypothetical protein